jgi:uncharacterized protein YgiM (DUF1202 family)
MKNVFLPIFLSCIASLIIDSVKEASNSLNKTNTAEELESEIKKLDKSFLEDYIAIKASILNIREDKNEKSKIIGTLEFGSVVEVLDKSNNNWVQIMTTDNDEIIGWVFKKYTIPLKI